MTFDPTIEAVGDPLRRLLMEPRSTDGDAPTQQQMRFALAALVSVMDCILIQMQVDTAPNNEQRAQQFDRLKKAAIQASDLIQAASLIAIGNENNEQR